MNLLMERDLLIVIVALLEDITQIVTTFVMMFVVMTVAMVPLHVTNSQAKVRMLIVCCLVYSSLLLCLTSPLLSSYVVCRDGSCGETPDFPGEACFYATIDYVVGPSCTDSQSCKDAKLSGVDLVNSCRAKEACEGVVKGIGGVSELDGCCNEKPESMGDKCQFKSLDAIVANQCVSVTVLLM